MNLKVIESVSSEDSQVIEDWNRSLPSPNDGKIVGNSRLSTALLPPGHPVTILGEDGTRRYFAPVDPSPAQRVGFL